MSADKASEADLLTGENPLEVDPLDVTALPEQAVEAGAEVGVGRYHELLQGHAVAKDLNRKSVRGVAATTISQAATFTLRLGSTAILARILTPKDYGLVAMTAVVTGFVGIFKEAGLTTATIQRAEITHEQVTMLFWINLLLRMSDCGCPSGDFALRGRILRGAKIDGNNLCPGDSFCFRRADSPAPGTPPPTNEVRFARHGRYRVHGGRSGNRDRDGVFGLGLLVPGRHGNRGGRSQCCWRLVGDAVATGSPYAWFRSETTLVVWERSAGF